MKPAELHRAIQAALSGEWHEAHGIVQADEADPIACWIHAVLHKIEGDAGNARYWYRKADRLGHVTDDPTTELAVIREAIQE